MKKEIITEKRYSFELGGIRLKTGSVIKDSLIEVYLTDELGGGIGESFSKQDIKNLSTLFNELVSELEKEEEIKTDTPPCSSCQNTYPDPFNINCVSCDETFSKYKGEEKEIKEPILKGCGNCLNQNNQMGTQDCEKCCTSLLLGWKPYVEPKEEIREDKPEPTIKACGNCIYGISGRPSSDPCNDCSPDDDKWEPKE